MDKIAVDFLKDKLLNLKGNEFQNAMDGIMSIIYERDYTEVKQKRDKGCDGILYNQKILAAYAPEKYDLADFKKKTNDDFKKYSTHWQNTHKKWAVVTNTELTSSMILHVNSLYHDSEIIGVLDLISIIRNAPWVKVIKIFRALQIPERYCTYDLFSFVIEDLIGSNDPEDNLPYEKPIYIEEKISLNILDEESIEIFTEEYEEYFEDYKIIANILSNYSPNDVSALRNKIRSNYLVLAGSFLEKIVSLTIFLAGERKDEIYKQYIRKLVFYFFEQCLIGIKTKIEKKND